LTGSTRGKSIFLSKLSNLHYGTARIMSGHRREGSTLAGGSGKDIKKNEEREGQVREKPRFFDA